MNKLFLALGLFALVFGQAYSTTLTSGSCASSTNDGLAFIFFDKLNESPPVTTGVTLVPSTSPLNFFLAAKTPYPGSDLSSDGIFKISMGGYFLPPASGSYQFRINCDDGDFFSLDGATLINDYGTHSVRSRTSTAVYLHAGQKYFVSIEYFNNDGTATFALDVAFNGGSFLPYTTSFKPCSLVPTPLTLSCGSSAGGLRYHYFTGNSIVGSSFSSAYAGSVTSTNMQFAQTAVAPAIVGGKYPFSFKATFAFLAPTTGTYRFAFIGSNNNYGGISIGGIDLFFLTETTSQSDARVSLPVDLVAGKYYSMEYSLAAKASNWRFEATYSIDGGNFTALTTSVVKNCQNHGVVTPYRVSISGNNKVSIPVRLRTPPTGKVSVIVKPQAGVTVSSCILYFDQTNWNVPQTVFAYNTASEQTVDFVPSSTVDSNYDGTAANSDSTTMILGTPSTSTTLSVVGAMCTSWGDPHVVTLDGSHFDNQGVGDYYLIRTLDSNFVVQARQAPCGGGAVSCQYALAIKYGAGVFHVYFDKTTGVPSLTGNPAAALYGNAVTYDSATRRYTFNFPNAFSVDARIDWWGTGKTWYFSVYISVPVGVCGTRGVCGSYDNNPSNDLILPNGSPAASLSAFLNSYVVPTNEKLLENPDATIPTLNSVETCNPVFTNCTVDPNPPPPICLTCVPPPPPACTTCPPCDITQAKAETFCSDKFLTTGPFTGCPGINVTSLYIDCVVEVVNMCDYDAAGPSYEYAAKQCCLTNPTTCPPCDSNCNGNGNCISGECSCDPNYSGPSCVPDGTPCSATATPTNPGVSTTTVVVSGAFFPGGNKPVTCVFTSTPGGLITLTSNGKSTSEFQATCDLPTLPNGDYLVVVKDGLVGDSCGAIVHKTGSGSGDPHFYGFNGEKMEVKKDDNAANQIYHLYCSESVTISTLFYEYPDKLLFMTRFWVRLGDVMFTLNLSPVPKIVTSHEPATFIPELGRFRVEIPDGHLEWDDSKLRVVYKYLRINFSNHVYLNGDAYMNIDFSGVSVPTETKINGIIGRTVYNRLTNEEFAQYEQFRGSVSDVVSFTCPL